MSKVRLEETEDRRRLHIGSCFFDLNESEYQELVRIFSIRTREADVIGSLRFSEREVDFAYLCGVFNTSGIDGLYNEIQRLKEIGKEPHDIIEACRKQ